VTVLHHLKTWPTFFDAVARGDKTFELRKNDRCFEVGDEVILEEWDPDAGVYTGRKARRRVTYALEDFPLLVPGACVLGLQAIDDEEAA
jgi:hypothetical protein